MFDNESKKKKTEFILAKTIVETIILKILKYF